MSCVVPMKYGGGVGGGAAIGGEGYDSRKEDWMFRN